MYYTKENVMGAYVNPKDKPKEGWLVENGVECNPPTPWAEIASVATSIGQDDHFLPVVLMDNGMFTAAGVAYSEREYKEFLDPNDMRPKRVFMVQLGKLKTVSRELPNYLK
jgi:hypothetical protein